MKKIKFLSFLLSAALVFTLCGCDFVDNFIDKITDLGFGEEQPTESSSSQPEVIMPEDPNWPVTVFGCEVETMPSKVAVASPALAEYISDMGIFGLVCAVPDHCSFGGASVLPSIGSVRLPDMEAIKEAAPEYILTFTQYEEEILIKLQQMDITVIVIEAPKTLDELRELYRRVAIFFLGEVDGDAFGESYVEDYNALLDSVAYTGEKKTAAFIRSLDYVMVTGGTLENELLSRLGFINAAEEQSGYTFAEENWADFDPAVIFLNSDIHLIDLESSDLYKKKNAVKGDKVYNVDLDAVALCSKRSLALIKDMLATVYEDYTLGTPLEPAYPSMYS